MEYYTEEKEKQNKKLSKKDCQNLINQVEKLIRQYAHTYPDCVDDAVLNRRKIYMWVLVIASIALVTIQPCIAHGFLVFGICVGALASTEDMQYIYTDSYDESNYDHTLRNCKEMLSPYADFPDVKKYFDSIEPILKKHKANKIKYRVLGGFIMVIFFAVVVGYLYYVWRKVKG